MGCVEMERQASWVTMDHLTSVNPHLMRGWDEGALTTPTADMQVLPVLMPSAPFLGSAVGTPSVAVGEEKKPLHATPHSFAEPPSGVATRTAEEVALKGKPCFWTPTQKGNLELLEIISRIGADEDGRKRQAQLPELML
ncbi:hypothetical protein ILYODFUR_000275 [Ilyodon furcidens]|uniref:Prolactin receptor n=1 Tax=Ilyodon furcidens TaxID=33524 RepID=A0ABV0V9V0_9TELE